MTFWTASVHRMLRKGNEMRTFPVSIFCPEMRHEDTDEDHYPFPTTGTVAEYECECGHKGTFDFKKDYRLQARMEDRLADALEI